ncbi:MAG: glycosyltransferase [Candidatus Micrarchaeia archaeon]
MAEKVTLVLPVYNEEHALEHAVRSLKKEARKLNRPFEIIIAEDGSVDGTYRVAKRLARGNIRMLHSRKRLGRGAALSRAIEKADSDIVAYIDVDLASSLAGLRRLVRSVEKGAAISTGSRMLPGAAVKRSAMREIASRAYNLLVRLLFGSRIHDHQCGFKAFRRSAVLPLLEEVEDRHWFWDTELLVRAQANGLRVDEFPITWKEGKGSKVRLWADVTYMLGRLIALRFKKLKSEKIKAGRRFPSPRAFREWNERMFKMFNTERLYRHPNPFVAWVENERVRRVVAEVAGEGSVLDVGCGEGVILEKIGAGKAVGLDLSREALRRARARVPEARLTYGDAQRLPFRDSSFDAVVCSEIIEHVPKPRRVLEEAARVVKPNGKVIVTIPEEKNINRVKGFLKRLGLFNLLLPNVPERMESEWHLHAFSLELLKKTLPGELRVEKILDIPPFYPIRRVVVFRVRKAFK